MIDFGIVGSYCMEIMHPVFKCLVPFAIEVIGIHDDPLLDCRSLTHEVGSSPRRDFQCTEAKRRERGTMPAMNV